MMSTLNPVAQNLLALPRKLSSHMGNSTLAGFADVIHQKVTKESKGKDTLPAANGKVLTARGKHAAADSGVVWADDRLIRQARQSDLSKVDFFKVKDDQTGWGIISKNYVIR